MYNQTTTSSSAIRVDNAICACECIGKATEYDITRRCLHEWLCFACACMRAWCVLACLVCALCVLACLMCALTNATRLRSCLQPPKIECSHEHWCAQLARETRTEEYQCFNEHWREHNWLLCMYQLSINASTSDPTRIDEHLRPTST